MQASNSASRKRPAPGSAASLQQSQTNDASTYDYTQTSPNDFGSYDFAPTDIYAQPDGTYNDPDYSDPTAFAARLNGGTAQYPVYGSDVASIPTSTELVRRSRNQLVQAGGEEQWTSEYDNAHANNTDDETEQDLERKVALAKRDAQGKRKQIPPFVQKLSSFLDSGNTDLIRWSDDGRSFIVIDEDEFARTLIPELFKHSNYASFVRQLNMYGFHKTVNITDGSLRQSEKARKGVKPPSMYSHPYFRRNRPDLLWLIQKPTSKTGTKRKRDGTVKGEDSDDDRQGSPSAEIKPLAELGRTGSQELVTMPKTELAHVRRELIELRRSQKYIRDVIEGLKKQNDQFYRQATQFQDLHQRHENSINAILTFLATFYNRSLDGQAGQNLVNMFTSAAQQHQTHGSVVEDLNESTTPETSTQLQRYRKPPLLLGPGPATSVLQADSTATASTSNRSSISPASSTQPRVVPARDQQPAQNLTADPPVKLAGLTPNVQSVPAESDQMMSLINTVNANSPGTDTPSLDFSAALNHYQNANGNSPLTTQQRNDVLSMMANQQNGGANNALVSPAPPQMPDMSRFKETQTQLEMLQNMQKAQDEKVQELNRRLQPLSPTGAIPGIGEDGDVGQYFDTTGAPGDFDPSSFLTFDNDDGEVNFNFDSGNDNINWDFGNDGNGDMFQQNNVGDADGVVNEKNRVESIDSAAGSDAAPIGDQVGSNKRARRS